MNIYFYSDPHFYHNNIIKYCNRPFENTFLMNKHLIKEYNKIVRDEDIVYFLGDIGLGATNGMLTKIISQLNGTKILIRGNHDRAGASTYIGIGFSAVLAEAVLQVGNRLVTLTHRPKYDIGWNFCGHVHNNWKTDQQCINCSVEMWDYKPIVVSKLVHIMDTYDEKLSKEIKEAT